MHFTAKPTFITLSFLLSLFIATVNGQGVTTITDVGGETLTTSVSPTVYTTNGEAYTFVPSTPATPTPSIRSFGSVQNLQDYMVSRSQKGVAGSAPPVTATAVLGGGGQNKVNVVQSNVGAISSAKGLVVASSLLVSLAATLIQ